MAILLENRHCFKACPLPHPATVMPESHGACSLTTHGFAWETWAFLMGLKKGRTCWNRYDSQFG